jgi:hypothetical protein
MKGFGIQVVTFKEDGKWHVEIVRVGDGNLIDEPCTRLNDDTVPSFVYPFEPDYEGFYTRDEARGAIRRFNAQYPDYAIQGGLH